MEFLVLGPLQVYDAGRSVTIGAPRQRALLAVLLANSNRVVSADRLLDLVWGDDPPEVGALRYQISKLRDALEPDRESGDGSVIITESPGYILRVTPGQLDSLGFESLLKEAELNLSTDRAGSLASLDEALGLWRGDAYADFAYEEFARPEIVRLEERRLEAIEARFDALLALGRDRDVVGELQALVAEHPHRERLTGALMLALYRSGRQADALAAYQSLRSELGESLGIEPSKELVDLEGRILLQDESLSIEAPTPAAEYLRGYALRGRIGEGAHGVVWRAAQPGVGREVAIKAIHPDIANRPGFVRRFEMEAQLVASLEHPHIVSLFDFWRDPEGAYLVMPHLRGGNLAQLLLQGPLQADTGLQLVEDIGDALAYAHRRGVVHRDVTPENVLLDDEGHPYLADFGVAALIGETGPPTSSSPAYLAPELHDGGAVPETDIYSLGVLTHAVLTGEIPMVDQPLHSVSHLNPNLPEAVDEVIARATAIDIAERFIEPNDFVAALTGALDGGRVVRSSARELRNPYKGLRAFSEADSPDFFGRDVAISELVDAVARNRLVAVVGPSGCGKSSLVRAGLLADLRQGALPGSERWLITDMYPGVRPLNELAEALMRVAVERPTDLVDRLAEGAVGDVLGRLLPGDTEILLVVDQFEELFTLTPDEEERRRFLDVLVSLTTDSASRARVVVTLRADFFDRPLGYAGFGDLLRRGMVPIAVPSVESMEQAVVGPAESASLRVEQGLERVITQDVADQPGGLPLLEFALTELFHERVGSDLTAAGYQRTGGVLGALGRRAEDLYVGCDDAGREAIEQVFLRLVTVEEGVEDTRRRIMLAELHEIGIEPDTLQRVLDDYGTHRLITFDRDPETRAPTVEVAHEALLSRWDRLRSWIDERRDDLVIHRRLAASVKEWHDSERRGAYLLTGGRLEHYERFAEETDLALTGPEQGFLLASRQAEDDALAGRRRKRMTILGAFAAAAVIAAVLAIVALISQRRAEEEAELNRARVLSAQAIDAIGTDNQLAMLLALEAADVGVAANGEVLPETVDALHQSLQAERLEEEVPLDSLPAGRGVGLAANGSGIIALSSTGDTVELRSGEDPETVVATLGTPLETDETMDAAIPSFDPSGSHVATVGSDGVVHVWDVASRLEVWSQPGHATGPGGAIYSPDGRTLATIGDVSLVMWDAATGTEMWSIPRTGGDPMPAFSIDGTRLAVGGYEGRDLAIYDVATGEQLLSRTDWVPLGCVLWSPDESHLFVGLDVGDIAVVDASTLETVDVWLGHSRAPVAIAVDSSGTRVATGAEDGTTRVWDWTFGEELMVLTGGTGSVYGVAFLPGGDQLVVSGTDSVLRKYDVSAAGRGEVFGASLLDTEGSIGIDFSPDGSKLIALVIGGGFQPAGTVIWDIPGRRQLLEVSGLNWFAFDGVSFTNDGSGFVVQDWDESVPIGEPTGPGWGPVQLRDVVTGEATLSFAETAGQERQSLVFSQDGELLATGSTFSEVMGDNGVATASIHDAATGALLHRLVHEDWAVTGVALSPHGDLLATTTCGAGIVAVWDVATETMLWNVDYPGCATGIALSSDGSFIAASNIFNLPAVWDAPTGEPRFEIAGHSGGAYSIAISPDGSTVASAGIDGSILIVDSFTGQVVTRIQATDASVGDIDFSSDGTHLAASTTDGSFYVYVLDPVELVDLARSRTLRSLTASECAAYSIESCPLEE